MDVVISAAVHASARRIHHALVDAAKRALSAEHRELTRIGRTPRYTALTTALLGKPLWVPDSSSFVWMYNEIFKREMYRFAARRKDPYIIDCGANIGLSVIYFKKLYPAARVVAFEADQAVFQALSRNVRSFALADVTLHDAAVWHEETFLDFASEGADAGRLASGHPGNGRLRKVRAVRLRSYLADAPVDFLKVDIEGAETLVLKDCADLLPNVERLFVEYHSFEGRPQTLHELLAVLSDAGFRVYVSSVGCAPQSFVQRESYLGMDMQLNIFAMRPSAAG